MVGCAPCEFDARGHALAGLPYLTRRELVRLELKVPRQALGAHQKQARVLRFLDDVASPLAAARTMGLCVEATLGAADGSSVENAIAPSSAWLSTPGSGAARLSQFDGIMWIQPAAVPAGCLCHAPNPTWGAGPNAYLSKRTIPALGKWRQISGLEDGAVFRRLHLYRDRKGTGTWTVGAGLSGQSVTLIYRTMLDAAPASKRQRGRLNQRLISECSCHDQNVCNSGDIGLAHTAETAGKATSRADCLDAFIIPLNQ